MIELMNVTKTYPKAKNPAVAGLNLSVSGGELFGFLGPNGAGKTTTIRMLVGLLKPDSGVIRICSMDTAKRSLETKRRIGFVPDETVLYEKMSGWKFLSFIARVYDVKDAAARIRELAEEFDIASALGEPISSYSHGMKQKISVIAALAHKPDVFILDEPMTGLDPRAAFTLKEKMRAHCRGGGTVFFSTHVMEVAEKLCDRVGIIHKGSLVAQGPMGELRAKSGDESLEQIFLELTDENAAAS